MGFSVRKIFIKRAMLGRAGDERCDGDDID